MIAENKLLITDYNQESKLSAFVEKTLKPKIAEYLGLEKFDDIGSAEQGFARTAFRVIAKKLKAKIETLPPNEKSINQIISEIANSDDNPISSIKAELTKKISNGGVYADKINADKGKLARIASVINEFLDELSEKISAKKDEINPVSNKLGTLTAINQIDILNDAKLGIF